MRKYLMPSIQIITINTENLLLGGSQMLPLGSSDITVTGKQALSRSIDIWDFDDEDKDR